jgi:hypothetical protein
MSCSVSLARTLPRVRSMESVHALASKALPRSKSCPCFVVASHGVCKLFGAIVIDDAYLVGKKMAHGLARKARGASADPQKSCSRYTPPGSPLSLEVGELPDSAYANPFVGGTSEKLPKNECVDLQCHNARDASSHRHR